MLLCENKKEKTKQKKIQDETFLTLHVPFVKKHSL